MAEKKRSIIEEALLEAKSMEDALKANTKEILASHMKEEIENIVESSLKEQDEEELEIDVEGSDEETEEMPTIEVGDDSELELDVELGDMEGEELDSDLEGELEDIEGDESELDVELDLDGESLGDAEGMEFDLDAELDLDGELPMGGEGIMDLTDASDDEVLKVFKSMSDNDEVEVVKDADGIHLKDSGTGAEYYIKDSIGEEMDFEGEGMEDEVEYEIELDDDSELAGMLDETEEEVEEGAYIEECGEEEEETIEEDRTNQRTKGKQRYSGAKVGSKSRMKESRRLKKPLVKESNVRKSKPTVSKEKPDSRLLREYKELKSKNEEYKSALKLFKGKLNEVALFNTNLAYVNRLFTENTTTKKEKMGILKRFDEVESIKESQKMFKAIKGELENKTPLTESVEEKVNKSVKSSSASNLNESTAYVDPQIKAIKDLMHKIS